MNGALVVAGKDLRERLRDRSALVLSFVAPVVIATVLSLAFRSTASFHTSVAVVDQDGGRVAAAFAAMLHERPLSSVVSVQPVTDEQQARAEVRKGTLGAVFVLPKGLTAQVTQLGRPVSIGVLGSADQAIARQVGVSIAQSFAAQVNADRLSVETALASGAPLSALPELAAASARLQLPIAVTSGSTHGKQLTATSYMAMSMGIFFMFFGIGFGARSFWSERSSGNLDRILVSPAGVRAALIGKSLSTAVFGLASLTTMAVVTSSVFGADWGPAPAAAALIIAIVLAAAALTGLVSTLARSERQADGLASMVTFGLVLLGGNFVFVSAEPDLMRRLALATPNGWAIRGFVDLQGGASSSSVLVPLAVILAFTTGIAAVAGLLARRAVQR